MKIIIESSTTKTEWCLVDGGKVVEKAVTVGLNPFFMTRREISHCIRLDLPKTFFKRRWEHVYFYGAGCSNDDKKKIIESSLVAQFKTPTTVESDLLGAARALCGHEAGLACILGTGANSCYYDGHDILQNTPPLGYILGDEGSGAVMGKTFVADVLKGLMPDEVVKDFFALAGTTYAEIINRVYRQPLANRYLAQYSRIVFQLRDRAAVHDFLIRHFRLFIRRNIVQYAHPELSLNFVGGIAGAFGEELREAAGLEGYRVGRIEQVPLPGLLLYHQS